MKPATRRSLQWTMLLVLVVVAGIAGLRFGSVLRARNAPVIVEAPEFPFKPGDAFPDVRLADSLGTETGSLELVRGKHGAVILFLDSNCEGCKDMAVRWEQGVAEGVIEPERIFGITMEMAEKNAQYRVAQALSFPIFQDVESAFLNRHGVVTYPMEVVVAASGTIQSLSTDSKTPIDAEFVRAAVNEQ
jgi:peroxiredoxin